MGGAYLEQAARVTDPVAHTDTSFAFGLSIVFLVGGGLLMAPVTVAGAIAVVSTAAFAQSVGAQIDARRPKNTDEQIAEGAETVFLDEPRHRAAKADPTTILSPHASHWVISGSDTVLIERFNASRVGDKASCAGTIVGGSTTVYTGGAQVFSPGQDADPDEVLGSDFYRLYSMLLKVGSYADLPRGRWAKFTYGAGALNDFAIDSDAVSNLLFAESAVSRGSQWTEALIRAIRR